MSPWPDVAQITYYPLKKKKKLLCAPGWLRNFDGSGGPSLEEEWHLALVRLVSLWSWPQGEPRHLGDPESSG